MLFLPGFSIEPGYNSTLNHPSTSFLLKFFGFISGFGGFCRGDCFVGIISGVGDLAPIHIFEPTGTGMISFSCFCYLALIVLFRPDCFMF